VRHSSVCWGNWSSVWVTEKGGPCDPTTKHDAGGTPASKLLSDKIGRSTSNRPDRMDLQDVSGRLRKLSPQQEKVIRLYFGLGCERPHSASAHGVYTVPLQASTTRNKQKQADRSRRSRSRAFFGAGAPPFPLAHVPLLVDRVIASSYGGSPYLRFDHPDPI